MRGRHLHPPCRFLMPGTLAVTLLLWSAALPVTGTGTPTRSIQDGSASDTVRYVIHVSVDGLRSDVVGILGPRLLPNFYRMRVSGALTDDARTDYDYTITLPNHACQLTGRPVLGPDGHNVSFNSDPGTTLEAVNGRYIAGVFDVVHDSGGKTAMYASKAKFAFFERSWNAENGAPDVTGEDDGRDKIDIYLNLGNTEALVDSFVAHMTLEPSAYSFIHFVDPDVAGHDSGWRSATYYNAVISVDDRLGKIFSLIDGEAQMRGGTSVLVTSDHGGSLWTHDNATFPANYTIPMYVMGPGVPAGAGLYELNPVSRADPGDARPDYEASPQPVRNGGASNLALDLLGLGPIPGSVINDEQDLEVTMPGEGFPSVEITSPVSGEVLDGLAAIEIEVASSTSSGVITKVEFYADWDKIGEDTESPFGYTWREAPAGDHVISARAVRDDNLASVASVDVVVISAGSSGGGELPHERVRIYPNPMDRTTTIAFSLGTGGRVMAFIYDILGRRVGTLLDGYWGPGDHVACTDVSYLAPGLYFYRARIGDGIVCGKFMVLR